MHHCHCEEEEESSLLIIIRLIISLALLLFAIFNPIKQLPSLYIYIVSYLVIGYDVLFRAVKNLFTGHPFDENLLMSIASICGFFIEGYMESVLVILLYQLGELLQDKAVDSSRKSIQKLLDIKVDKAHRINDDNVDDIDAYDIQIGDILLVKTGERIPVDGVIVEGQVSLDTSSLTGESLPLERGEGDNVLSGSINLNATIKMRATKLVGESTSAQILECIEQSEKQKANSEKFITKFAKIYTPVVIGVAILLVLIPTLCGGNFHDWLYRGCIFLVISCPCALVISIPLTFFVGIGSSAKKGVIFKGGNHLETLSKIQTILFDKTGTITKGTLKVLSYTNDETLKVAAIAESFSNHPIAKAIVEAYKGEFEQGKDYHEYAGLGVEVQYQDKIIKVGKLKYVDSNDLYQEQDNNEGTPVYVSINDTCIGSIVIGDEAKDEAKEAISILKGYGIKTGIVSGDNNRIVKAIGEQVDIDMVFGEQLPLQKVEKIEELQKDGPVAFVGDGINDAPALLKSSVGIAMGTLGSEAAVESGDVILMNDNLKSLCDAIKVSKKTVRIAKQNLVFIVLFKLISMVLGALGILPMWGAVVADVGVCLLTILNSLRVRL